MKHGGACNMTDEALITAGKHAGAAMTLIGLGTLIAKAIIAWRKKRQEKREAIMNKLTDLCRGQQELSEQMVEMDRKREEAKSASEARGEALASRIENLSKDVRLSVSASVAGLNGLMQHDPKVNGPVKKLHDALQDRIVEGIGGH